MSMNRRNHSADFKAKIAIQAIKGEKTLAQIASEHQIHPVQISQWKKTAQEAIPAAFSQKQIKLAVQQEELTAQLYQQIGKLKVELDFLKKKSGLLS